MDGNTLLSEIEAAGLGPVTSVEVMDTPDGGEALLVELDATSPRKARTLLRWMEGIRVIDMVAGKYRATDSLVRLNLRGLLPTGDVVIVVAAFDEHTETRQTELIDARIEARRPHELVTALAALETPAIEDTPMVSGTEGWGTG